MSDERDPVSAAIAALRARQTGQAGDHGEPGVRLASDEGARAQRMAEALLFAASEALDVETLAARLPAGADVRALLGALQDRYAGAGVNLVEVGGRWRFQTAPDLAHLLADIREEPKKLSQAGLETLSIIAYHQPVTRAEIEEIRGVAVSKGTVDLLFELGWIRLRGRRRSPGRPVTYGTTDAFLDYFGLAALSDLPGLGDLKAAGLLSSRLPPDFDVPQPGRLLPGEDPLEDGEDASDFHLDFLSEDEPRE
ncbi:SMC-Scp complex subunit ScpB [Glycocaulis profundi]|nr:SMC-Scp complex subunit ScpB [Glycocaulis profundi]